jgi:hypothetical protein
MASRSRLGRDPLDGVAQPAAKKPTKPKAPAKAGQSPAKGKTARSAKPATPAKPASVPTSAEVAPVLEQDRVVAPQPIAESVLLPEPPQAEVAAPVEPVEPFPRNEALAAQAAAPVPETRSRAPELPECAAAAPLPAAPEKPAQSADSQPEEPSPAVLPEVVTPTTPAEPFPHSKPRGEPAAAVAPDAITAAPAAAPGAATLPEDTPPVDAVAGCAPCQACRTPDVQGPHPTEVFLRGILEGLATAGGLSFDVAVAPETFDLPVETLFYCSHALQLLVSPLEAPGGVWHRPGGKADPPARVSVRLGKAGSVRHSLRVYDNGHFFRRFLPEISLDTEVLRPLLLFVLRRGGSICLKRGGACVEFEIIG